jgi:hypothetical protein
MFGSTIIDVAVGLIFIYFLLSMVSSHINEIIANILAWRARDLEEGIRTLLADPALADKVWNHPLIRGLAGKGGRDPSYIPANTFTLALFDAIAPGGNDPTAMAKVRMQVSAMSDSSVRRALLSMLDKANGDMVQARSEIESWFNAAMDRVTGIYKRRIQWVTLGVALVVTLIFGVDSLALANSLWKEPGLRAALTGAAQATQTAQTTRATALQDAVTTLSQFTLPIGWTTSPITEWDWVQKVIGLALTTLAVSLGAPFWFDLLKNLANLRSSGPAPKT